MKLVSLATFLQHAQKINRNQNVNKILLAHFLQQEITWIYANLHSQKTEKQLFAYLEIVQKYVEGYPLGYLLGSVIFLDCQIFVNQHVLIPRPETEQLVIRIIELANKIFKNQAIKVLDLGTGSGCVGIALAKKHEHWNVLATDISQNALDVTKLNIEKNQVKNIKIQKSDLFAEIKLQKFHLIVSNPPYIDFENDDYNSEQLKYEPSNALFAKNQGLFFYETILKEVRTFCNDQFLIAFEIGNQQKDKITQILQSLGWNSKQFWFETDINKHWRFLFLSNAILT